MTDEPGLAAMVTFRDDQIISKVTVQCLANKALSYTLEFQQPDGSDAAINWPNKALQVRIDNDEPRYLRLEPLQYPNVIVLKDDDVGERLKSAGGLGPYFDHWNGDLADYAIAKMSLAKQLRLKIALFDDEVIVPIDQTGPELRRVLNECGVDPQKLAEGAEAEEEADRRAEEAYALKLEHGDTMVPAANQGALDAARSEPKQAEANAE